MSETVGDVSPPLTPFCGTVDDIGTEVRDPWSVESHGNPTFVPEAACLVQEGSRLDSAQSYGEPRKVVLVHLESTSFARLMLSFHTVLTYFHIHIAYDTFISDLFRLSLVLGGLF